MCTRVGVWGCMQNLPIQFSCSSLTDVGQSSGSSSSTRRCAYLVIRNIHCRRGRRSTVCPLDFHSSTCRQGMDRQPPVQHAPPQRCVGGHTQRCRKAAQCLGSVWVSPQGNSSYGQAQAANRSRKQVPLPVLGGWVLPQGPPPPGIFPY